MQKKSLETILYSSAGIAVMLVLLIAANVIVGARPVRVDMTQEKASGLLIPQRGDGRFMENH